MKTYLRHKILNVVDVKELIALEYLDFEGKYQDYAESHDFWELCYIERGTVVLLLEDREQMLLEREIILIPPNKRHSYFSLMGNANSVFVICFESSSQSLRALSEFRFFAEREQTNQMKQIIEESKKTFRMNESDLLEALPNPIFGGQQVILLQLERLLIYLLRRLSVEKNSDVVFLNGDDFYKDMVEVILRYFRRNLHEKLSLDDICERFNYSRSFLCKMFKEETGESLMTCFARLKMEEAARMLAHSDKTVSAIATELGYSEAKYFCATFKKHMGVSPGWYRKQQTEDGASPS